MLYSLYSYSLLYVKSVNVFFQVILSVPQYKSTAASSLSSAASADSSSSDLSHNSLTVTPVLKLDSPDREDLADGEEEEEEGEKEEEEEELEDSKRSSYALDNILSNQTQSFFSLEQFKQASLIFQKHTSMNGNGLKGSPEFLQHSIWNNLVSSTVASNDNASNDEKRKIHKCDFPACDKIYTKSSHLKAHKR